MPLDFGMIKMLHYVGIALWVGFIPAEAILVAIARASDSQVQPRRAVALMNRLAWSHGASGMALTVATGAILALLADARGREVAGLAPAPVLLVAALLAIELVAWVGRRRFAAAVDRGAGAETRGVARWLLGVRAGSGAGLLALAFVSIRPELGAAAVLGGLAALAVPFALYVAFARHRIGVESLGAAGILPDA